MMRKKSCLLILCLGLSTGTLPAASINMAKQLGNAFADAVEQAMPSVVVIRTQSIVYHTAHDLYMGRLYGIPERLAGQGSGVIVSKDGHILTSNHVIDQADQIEVVLHDGTILQAELIGSDPQTDLALLQAAVPRSLQLQPVAIGDSDALRVGEFVIAVGSPFSLESSVTVGIVSQKGRTVGLLPYEDFIQTDASINPGNSGGPLLDAEGNMVGINAVIQTGGPYTKGNIGIGFAIPVNLAMRVADSIMNTGEMHRPWIGVLLQELTASMAGIVGAREGVLIADVVQGAPAALAGMLDGDVIIEVENLPVRTVRDVQRAIFRRQIGEKIDVTLMRSGKKIRCVLTTERMPALEYMNR